MELPKFRTSGGDMLNGIKSKLGLGGESARAARGRDEYGYDGYADDGYQDDYAADYGEYGYSDDYGDEYAGGYDEGGYADFVDAPSTRRSSRDRSSSRGSLSPKLVSIEDVRARTQIPDRLNRDPLPERHVTSASSSANATVRGNRVLIDNTAPSPGSPESVRALRSSGLNSLFETTAESASSFASESASVGASFPTASSDATASATQPTTAFDPYDAYASSRVTAHVPERTLTVVKPLSYGDVERVAKVLRAGDVVVLSLTTTPADLVKRVLDFSFGVACYANARVDCIGDKVFAIIQGNALTEAETASLRSQGVI